MKKLTSIICIWLICNSQSAIAQNSPFYFKDLKITSQDSVNIYWNLVGSLKLNDEELNQIDSIIVSIRDSQDNELIKSFDFLKTANGVGRFSYSFSSLKTQASNLSSYKLAFKYVNGETSPFYTLNNTIFFRRGMLEFIEINKKQYPG